MTAFLEKLSRTMQVRFLTDTRYVAAPLPV